MFQTQTQFIKNMVIRDYEFLNYFDEIFLSHEVGYIKPEEEIYSAVQKLSGFSSDEHIFVDDILEYVDSSKEDGMGWDSVCWV